MQTMFTRQLGRMRQGFVHLTLLAGLLFTHHALASEADQAFESLYKEEWQKRQLQYAVDENADVSRIPVKLPSVHAQAQAERLAYWESVLSKLDGISLNDLTDENQINYRVFKFQIQSLINDQKFKLYEKPLTGDTSFWGDLTYMPKGQFLSQQDYQNYLLWLADMPRYFEEQIANMRAGLARGFTPPAIALVGRDATAASVANAAPRDTIYFKPFSAFPATFSDELKQTLSAEAEKVIRSSVIPAYQQLLTFLADTYIPGAVTELDAFSLPNGRDFYQSQIFKYTTLTLSPEEIHEIGLGEVRKIKARMHDIMREVEFDGDLSAFLTFLRTDPQFYVTTPQALLDRAAWTAKEFDAVAKNWFGRLPRSRFAIIPVPDDIAPYYTAGRGGPGMYLVNTYDLPSRPLYSLPALTLHESAPGHAFQMPLAAENEDIPAFRRNTYISAYGEGWALYSEKLGEEMGMYHTPYEIFGMLSYQMWRAARLVVDTGIHAKGWSRKQAQDFMKNNTALSVHEVTTEVDRYIAWPGQALSYYLGQMKIEALRAKAEKALGSKFDIRAFHDTVLQLGSVPLSVLEARIERFIAEGGPSPYSNL